MKNNFKVKVYYSDTDCYGVVWHGAYVKWVEQGRTELCNNMMDVESTEKNGTMFPVVELNLRYKHPAKLFDELSVETKLKELKKASITFETTIKNQHGRLILIAISTIVSTDLNAKLNRKLPESIYENLKSYSFSN